MVSSANTLRMTVSQRDFVHAALKPPFSDGIRFLTPDTLRPHLRDLVADTLLKNHLDEIFELYSCLHPHREERSSPPSPPDSDRRQSNTFERGSLDREISSESTESTDTSCPSIDTQGDRFVISYHCPLTGRLRPLNAIFCRGNVSYVSADTVRTKGLEERRGTSVLEWRGSGTEAKFSSTRFVIVPNLPNAWQVAIAVDHGKEDEELEEAEEEEGEEDEVLDGPHMRTDPDQLLLVGKPGVTTISRHTTSEFRRTTKRIAGELIAETAVVFAKQEYEEKLQSLQTSPTDPSLEHTHKKRKISRRG